VWILLLLLPLLLPRVLMGEGILRCTWAADIEEQHLHIITGGV